MDKELPECDGFTIADTIGDERSVLEESLNEEDSDFLINKLGRLNERQQDIIKRRFGLHGGEPETLQDISDSYKLTKERIRQIEAHGIRKLRKMCMGEIDSSYYR
jgi:RNA polymerase sigma factor (sigma-70 family)